MAEHLTLPAVISPQQVETGMVLRIHQKIKDVNQHGDEKERVQIYEGTVINVSGKNASKTMTVRKVSSNIGVERIFPLRLPSLLKLELVKKLKVRRKNIGFIRHSKKRLREDKNVVLKATENQA